MNKCLFVNFHSLVNDEKRSKIVEQRHAKTQTEAMRISSIVQKVPLSFSLWALCCKFCKLLLNVDENYEIWRKFGRISSLIFTRRSLWPETSVYSLVNRLPSRCFFFLLFRLCLAHLAFFITYKWKIISPVIW